MDRYTHEDTCPHGRPREDRTPAGMPKCPPCRKREMYALRSKGRRPTPPRMTQPALIDRRT